MTADTTELVQKIYYPFVYPFFNLIHPCRVVGREHIPKGGALICANHSSYADPVLLCFVFRRRNPLHFMAKAELVRIPIFGAIIRAAGVFGVERGASDIGAVKQSMKLLKDGRKLVIFPEGTRSKNGEIGEAKTGAAMIALRCGVPMLPVYIPHKKKWFRRTTVVIGAPYMPEIAGKKPTQEEYQTASEELMHHIRELKELAQ
ncbi:MAG: 1-acyl-sn-glycerol-3-phosphate acyltransferase [Oscillospiraceae bacterium]|nr:1-acyl-sn-glycerol-3-phosphate acyltransferase [Oscillospiraceae bacterium]